MEEKSGNLMLGVNNCYIEENSKYTYITNKIIGKMYNYNSINKGSPKISNNYKTCKQLSR